MSADEGGTAVGLRVGGVEGGSAQPAGIESLYPFLGSGQTDDAALLEEVRRSTVAKANEIAELRERCEQAYGDQLVSCARDLADRFAAGGQCFTFGNGGSSTDAGRIASLLLAGSDDRRPLPALCLTDDTALLTALANDVGVEVIFARQLAALAGPSDIAVGLSTSGNSANLIRAFAEAARRDVCTVGFAGYDGGAMAELDTIDHLFVVPSSSVHRIQEAQTTLYQVLWELVHDELTGGLSRN
jgi:D-sedoheptulose 7-phosphate isomerase